MNLNDIIITLIECILSYCLYRKRVISFYKELFNNVLNMSTFHWLLSFIILSMTLPSVVLYPFYINVMYTTKHKSAVKCVSIRFSNHSFS